MLAFRRIPPNGVKLLGYLTTVVSLALVNLLTIPALVRASSLAEWGGFATGQAIGALASILISWGWGVGGPSIIAAGSDAHRGREFRDSLRVRLALAVIVLPLALLTTILSAPSLIPLALMGCLQSAALSLTSGWYFVGASQPWALFVLETVPRVVLSLMAIGVLQSGGGAVLGAVIMLAGVLIAALNSIVYVCQRTRAYLSDLKGVKLAPLMKSRISSVGVGSTSAAFSYLPLIIVSHFAPYAVGQFGLLDKIQKQASTAFAPFTNVAQGWVPRGEKNLLRERVVKATLGGLLGCLATTVGFAVFGPTIVQLLSAGQADYSYGDILLTGFILGLAFLESIVARACLIALGKITEVARCEFLGSIVGLSGVVLLAPVLDVRGVLLALSGGLATMLVCEGVILGRSLQRKDGP